VQREGENEAKKSSSKTTKGKRGRGNGLQKIPEKGHERTVSALALCPGTAEKKESNAKRIKKDRIQAMDNQYRQTASIMVRERASTGCCP